MRLVAVVAAIALFVAAPASASMWPQSSPTTLPTLKIARAHSPVQVRTCMVHTKVARWLAPVACEQPPRSQLLLASALYGD